MGGKRREDITVEPIELLPKEGEVIAGVRLHAAFFQCSRCGAKSKNYRYLQTRKPARFARARACLTFPLAS
jgi:DNA-directed RNA polymerase subunit M/transcription elongation factor TFIIS